MHTECWHESTGDGERWFNLAGEKANPLFIQTAEGKLVGPTSPRGGGGGYLPGDGFEQLKHVKLREIILKKNGASTVHRGRGCTYSLTLRQTGGGQQLGRTTRGGAHAIGGRKWKKKKKKEKKKIEEKKKKEEDGLFAEGPTQPEEEDGLFSVARAGLRRVSQKNPRIAGAGGAI